MRPHTDAHAPAHAGTHCHPARLAGGVCPPRPHTGHTWASSDTPAATAPGSGPAHSTCLGRPLPSPLATDCPQEPDDLRAGLFPGASGSRSRGTGHVLESVPMGTWASYARARPGSPHLWRDSHPLSGPPPPHPASHWDSPLRHPGRSRRPGLPSPGTGAAPPPHPPTPQSPTLSLPMGPWHPSPLPRGCPSWGPCPGSLLCAPTSSGWWSSC